LNFLDQVTSYAAQVFSDDPLMNSFTNVKIEEMKVNDETVFSQEIKEMN